MNTRAVASTAVPEGNGTWPRALALVGLLTLPVTAIAQSAHPSELCHEELTSIDVGEGGWSDIEEGRLSFKHVFQYMEDYPYFEYVHDAMLGVASTDWFPDGIVLSFDYWHTLKGRTGGPEGNHYSVIGGIYGNGNTHGISLTYSSDEAYAFLLFDHDSDDIRESVDRGALIGSAFDDGAWGVLTRVNDEIEFLNQDRRSIHLSCGRSDGYLFFDHPKLAFSGGNSGPSHCAAYADLSSRYGNEYLRSIFVTTERVHIANREYAQRKLCRHAWMPLAVTNSDALRPVLEERLSVWADRVHASVVAYKAAEAAAEAEQHRTRWVKVLEFPRHHRGDVRQSGENDVRIEFSHTERSDVTHTVYTRGHLLIIGVDLGRINFTTVGHVGGLFGRQRKREEARLKFEAGDFPTTTWNGFTVHRYVYDDNRYFECNGGVCSVHVRADSLVELGWVF